MRGKDQELTFTGLKTRITPAYAGKSSIACICLLWSGDHPRLCGEKPFRRINVVICQGITPAYAGKSQRF